jgi:hypothetical protein
MAIAPPKIRSKVAPPVAKKLKTFSVGSWNAGNEGEKVVVYGRSGIGKTTLAALTRKPVFISVDNGLIALADDKGVPRHPITGEEIPVISNIETFEDIRAVLQQPGLFKDYDTIIVDNLTKIESPFCEQYLFDNILHERGNKVGSIEGYGYGKGYRHLRDAMLLLLPDFDALVRAGKNVVLLAQNSACTRTNPGGEDFLEDGPRLYHSKAKEENSVRLPFCEWANHVFKVDYYTFKVEEKKIAGTTDRAIFVQPEVYFIAKTRTLKDPVVSFENQTDDTIWQALGMGVKK